MSQHPQITYFWAALKEYYKLFRPSANFSWLVTSSHIFLQMFPTIYNSFQTLNFSYVLGRKIFLKLPQNHHLGDYFFWTLCLCGGIFFFCIIKKAPHFGTLWCWNNMLTSHWFWTHSLIFQCLVSCLSDPLEHSII